jgi:hypothetical protein
MYIGSYQLGDMVALTTQVVNNNGTPVLPDRAPVAIVTSAAGSQITSKRMPVLDSLNSTALFQYRLSLDARFSVGLHSVQYVSAVGGTFVLESDTFEIMAGGNKAGRGLAMTFFRPPTNEYIVLQTDAGFMKRYKNPSIS